MIIFTANIQIKELMVQLMQFNSTQRYQHPKLNPIYYYVPDDILITLK